MRKALVLSALVWGSLLLTGRRTVLAQGVPDQILKGQRLMAVPLPGWQLDLMKPGDYVDVIVAHAQPVGPFTDQQEGDFGASTATAQVAKILLQNVRIAKVMAGEKVDGVGGIALVLNPIEAEYLALALAWGKGVYVAVRGPGDHEMQPHGTAGWVKLLK